MFDIKSNPEAILTEGGLVEAADWEITRDILSYCFTSKLGGFEFWMEQSDPLRRENNTHRTLRWHRKAMIV